MFKQIAARRHSRRIRDDFYGRIVALSRHPVAYAEWGVPDTPEGRFEMLTLCMFLVLQRLREEGAGRVDLAQDLTDAFFSDLDAAHRQMGVGDLKIPRRMRELAGVVEARFTSYREACETGQNGLAGPVAEAFSGHPDTPRVHAAAIAACAHALLAAFEGTAIEDMTRPETGLGALAGCKEWPSHDQA